MAASDFKFASIFVVSLVLCKPVKVLHCLFNAVFLCMSVVILLEAVLETFKTETQNTVDTHISSFLKHAPEKPGCPRHKVSFFNLLYSIDLMLLVVQSYCVAFKLNDLHR